MLGAALALSDRILALDPEKAFLCGSGGRGAREAVHADGGLPQSHLQTGTRRAVPPDGTALSDVHVHRSAPGISVGAERSGCGSAGALSRFVVVAEGTRDTERRCRVSPPQSLPAVQFSGPSRVRVRRARHRRCRHDNAARRRRRPQVVCDLVEHEWTELEKRYHINMREGIAGYAALTFSTRLCHTDTRLLTVTTRPRPRRPRRTSREARSRQPFYSTGRILRCKRER